MTVRPALAALLNYPIDYAGLYPPAKLGMSAAVKEYLSFGEAEDWLVDRFVCSVDRLGELDAEIRRSGSDEPIPVTVVGAPKKADAPLVKEFRDDWQTATGLALVDPQAYEAKVPAEAAQAAAKALGGSGLTNDVQAYLEFGWDEGWQEAMHAAPLGNEEVGFKARTGGVTAEAFPSVDDLSEFIYFTASLECPFKFTAGLHEPLRYQDTQLGVWRHGFLNVFCASAAAICHNLTAREIGEILEATDQSEIVIEENQVKVCSLTLSLEDLDEMWEWCGGFGSCSVQEPLDGLRRLGYLAP